MDNSASILTEISNELSLALENTPVAISKQDLNLVYTWISHIPEMFIGNKVVGAKMQNFIPPEFANRLTAWKQEVLASRRQKIHFLAPKINGRQYHLKFIIRPSFDLQGNLDGIVTIMVDISEFELAKTRLKEANRRLTKALEQALDAGWDRKDYRHSTRPD